MTEATDSNSPTEGEAFDAAAWLTEFEAAGGWLLFDTDQKMVLGWRVFRNERHARAAELVRALPDEQYDAVIEARDAEALRFDPAKWVDDFRAAGGSIEVVNGTVCTGAIEERADQALPLRNRLVPAEEDRLRAHLYASFGLPTPKQQGSRLALDAFRGLCEASPGDR